jgi:hypothetical protein
MNLKPSSLKGMIRSGDGGSNHVPTYRLNGLDFGSKSETTRVFCMQFIVVYLKITLDSELGSDFLPD